MNGRQLFRETLRDLERSGANIIMVEQRASHVTVRFTNRHGRLGKVILPRGHKCTNGHGWDNARADMRRQLRLLPGEPTNGNRHER